MTYGIMNQLKEILSSFKSSSLDYGETGNLRLKQVKAETNLLLFGLDFFDPAHCVVRRFILGKNSKLKFHMVHTIVVI